MPQRTPEPRSRRTALDSFRDAFRGVGAVLRGERHMRVHLCAGVSALALGLGMGLEKGELAVLCLTVGCVMAAEAMNTAVERLCDFNESRLTPRIRLVKDAAAGAVLLTAIAAVGVGLALFLRAELLFLAVQVLTTPWLLGLLAAWIAAALWFIFGWKQKD